jgi:hypothetical protein
MKTSFSFTTMPGLTPAHSPDLAPSDYHLFGPVKDELLGRQIADASELKQHFRVVLRSRGRECYNSGIQRLTLRGKVLKMTETLWKNSLIIASVRNVYLNFVVIAIKS